MVMNSFNSISSRMSDTSSNYSYKSADSSIRLEEHITRKHLEELLRIFQPKKTDHDQDNSQQSEKKTLAEFKDIVSKMLGTEKWNDQMEMLFYKVDTGCDGFVDWNEFCTYMVLQMREVEHIQMTSQIKPFTAEAIVKRSYHNKQETTTKMFLVENPTRIVNVSKVGDIGVWDTELRLLKNYKLSSNVAADETGAKRRCHTWVTDAIYMKNSQKFALTTTSREIYFYDTSTNPYYAEFCLYALPDVPNCVNYWYSETARNGHSILIFGDDEGSVHLLHFHSPQSRLFGKPFNPKQGIQRIYFNDLIADPEYRDSKNIHRAFVTYECIPNIHDEIIRRVMYVADGNQIVSSSSSSATSVVLMDLKKKKKPYIFKVNKGVECFDYSKPLNVLVTGSLDHLVRIWNPYVDAKPICLLQGHSTGICDVAINRSFGQIISYSKDAILKIWDIKEQNCLQTITLKIPSFPQGRIPDHGEFPLNLFEQPHDMMLVSCNDCIALFKMGKLKPPPEAPTTHEAPLCNAIYNDLFHQGLQSLLLPRFERRRDTARVLSNQWPASVGQTEVVTGADDSTVSVWNVENGVRSLKFSNAHGHEEITCIAFDKSWRRLFTGARDGTIKAWNFQNGNCLHEFKSIAEAEVTGIMSFQDQKVLAVGWSRQITTYDDSDPDIIFVHANTNWKGGQMHKKFVNVVIVGAQIEVEDDILTMDHCDPYYLATGSYDGTIIVWSEETEQISAVLKKSKALKGHQSTPVEKLLFLENRVTKERLSKNKKCGAVLLSSESGVIHLWSFFGHKHHLGKFSATDTPESSILGMASSIDNSLLITGDTTGTVRVWDISNFCVSDLQEFQTDSPPLKKQWKAHDMAIVSLNYIEYEFLGLIVTSSSDRTARLWTLDGKFIGTFGQKKKWNLKNPASFQHPRNPWGELVEDVSHTGAEARHTQEDTPPDHLPAQSVTFEDEVKDKVDSNTQHKSNNPVAEVGENAESHNEDLSSVKLPALPNLQTSKRLPERRMTTHIMAENKKTLPSARKLVRAETVSKFETPKEKILGETTEKGLAKRRATRHERRYRVGFINPQTTSRFGNLCSPFQALSIPNTDVVDFSPDLPMSRRMQDRGMECLSETDLASLPLHYLKGFADQDNDGGEEASRNPTRRSMRHGSPRRSTLLPATAQLPGAMKSSVAVRK